MPSTHPQHSGSHTDAGGNYLNTGTAESPVRWYVRTLNNSTVQRPPRHVTDAARGATMPLLALHGFTGNGADFRWLAAATQHVFDWRALDFLGHGNSDAPQHPPAYRAAPTLRAIHTALASTAAPTLPGNPNANATSRATSPELRTTPQKPQSASPAGILLGYSMGGRMALRYLASYGTSRVRGLILIGASAGLADAAQRQMRRGADRALARSIETRGIAAFMEHWNQLPIIRSQQRSPYFATLQQERRANRPTGLANSLRGIGTGAVAPVHSRLSQIHVPCLLLTGEEDTKFCATAQTLARLLPHATHITIPAAGHSPHWENPQACTAAILDWAATLQ